MTFLACLMTMITLGFVAKFAHMSAEDTTDDFLPAVVAWCAGAVVCALLLWATIALWGAV